MNILFSNPTFHKGRNVTCRRPKAEYFDLSLDDEVKLCDLDYIEQDIANIFLLARYESVRDIPQAHLFMEHDPDCRDHDGLLRELRRVYGNYSDSEPVLVIGFYVD